LFSNILYFLESSQKVLMDTQEDFQLQPSKIASRLLYKHEHLCSLLPFNHSAFTNEVSSEEGMAPPPTMDKPCKISLPLTYIIYEGRTSQAPLPTIRIVTSAVKMAYLGMIQRKSRSVKLL
jgi:hypothetical protein